MTWTLADPLIAFLPATKPTGLGAVKVVLDTFDVKLEFQPLFFPILTIFT